MSYATPDEVRAWLGVQNQVGPDDMPLLATVLAATEDAVNQYCGRTFGAVGSSEDRVFMAHGCRTMIDDAQTVTGVAYSLNRLNYMTIGSLYWYLDPPNRLPKTTLVTTVPVGPWVKVTGTFGYGATVPNAVSLATIMLATRLFLRRNSATGVMGLNEFGVVRVSKTADPDICDLLDPYRRVDRTFGMA